MRRITVLAAMAISPLTVVGCSGNEEASSGTKATVNASAAAKRAYFGWVLGSTQITGVAIAADKASGTRNLSIYVCDGLGPPQGKAVWFKGRIGSAVTRAVTIVSASKRERLVIDRFDQRLVQGSFRDSRGRRLQFVAYPARDGAGIYEVTLDQQLRYTGQSTDGSRVTAQADRKGVVKGTLTTAQRARIPFTIRTLALASPSELSAQGLSTTYRKDRANSLVPGEYVAVIAPSGTHWLGRAGNVRGGSPGAQIIGLDKKEITKVAR